MNQIQQRIHRAVSTSGIAPRLAKVREELAARQAQREARRALEREIAGYTSVSDLADLQAALGRSGTEADEVREILQRHQSTLDHRRLRAC
ncbi:MAG TPA: hypothetical protein VHM65_06985 [Candidatus Lustribacter sp.]|nr:hypothetical protein [Candidatus Lustribacter sp.]